MRVSSDLPRHRARRLSGDTIGGIIIVLFLLAGLVSAAIVVKGAIDCADKHGAYVRTVFWYECIDEEAP